MPVTNFALASTALRSASYNSDTQVLTVSFRSGQDYTFEGVPEDVANGLRDAQSPGSYFHQNIKGVYG